MSVRGCEGVKEFSWQDAIGHGVRTGPIPLPLPIPSPFPLALSPGASRGWRTGSQVAAGLLRRRGGGQGEGEG